ncbi:TetR/AcrR family transcriptional regulator [Anaerocolumna sp. MB42-C2]|uniref:TetR/AcrR family transcriptional regulator n=1 Tax=Anaerocolumna sp. MB42-C2 TaxID=3070997 RepID=UPI0027E0E9A1|nr:TetR/AcrR family transcriptional regulator [Anaerocolumna sp. MB42-C2]WMJ86649.1 TetR/AcrR family transcriptional regulator [Anaerocolumna sp. MB42-C2]
MDDNSLTTTTRITKQNLIDAFWKLYCKKTIDKITVTEICTLAGYNRSTFYVYFKDVYEILDVIENQVITADEFKRIILDQLLNNKDRKDLLRQLIQLFENNKDYLPVLLSEKGDPYFRQKLLKKLFPALISFFPDITNTELQEIKYTMEYQSAAMLSTISKWYTNGKDMPLERFLEILFSITTNGIQREFLKYKKP